MLPENQTKNLIAHYQKALLIKPDHPTTLYKVGNQYQYVAEFNRAFYYYLKAIQSNPNCHLYYYKLKMILFFSNIFNQSIDPDYLQLGIDLLKQTIEKQPNFLFAQYLLGNLLSQQGKVREAIACYQTFSYQQILGSHPQLAKHHWNPQKLRKPDFIICGLPKCGTTSIYAYLTSHPQVLTAVDKEINFFSHFFYRRLDYYYAHFPAIQDNNYLTGEATPSYLFWANPEQIFQLFPNIKLICLLRNPVDRAISSFYLFRRLGIGQNSLEQTFKFSIEHLKKRPELYLLSILNKKFSKDSLLEQISLLHTIPSLYIYFIKKWMKVFPKEQLLILKSEDFYGNPPATMKQVHHFLNLPDHQLTEYRNYNPGSYHSVPDALRCQLAEFFQPYNRELEDYLGRKFNWE
ncbi:MULTISPECIES: tetratricopeptide repeat-containing sulfotransferase family protein [Planktothrix]|uniref:tetratricopeptide repeat-containing sulfotransferase family protein n=1 Tax=Planktothrix TaxID=54304 RepID=UPI000410F8EB|nr:MULTISPECIES: sulfotransferase domain-containing protein [Planktothrix]